MNEKQQVIIATRMKMAAIRQLLRDAEGAGLTQRDIDNLLDTLKQYGDLLKELEE